MKNLMRTLLKISAPLLLVTGLVGCDEGKITLNGRIDAPITIHAATNTTSLASPTEFLAGAMTISISSFSNKTRIDFTQGTRTAYTLLDVDAKFLNDELNQVGHVTLNPAHTGENFSITVTRKLTNSSQTYDKPIHKKYRCSCQAVWNDKHYYTTLTGNLRWEARPQEGARDGVILDTFFGVNSVTQTYQIDFANGTTVHFNSQSSVNEYRHQRTECILGNDDFGEPIVVTYGGCIQRSW